MDYCFVLTALLFIVKDSFGLSIFTCNQSQYCINGVCYDCPSDRPFCDQTKQECVASREITDDNCPLGRDGAVPALDSCTEFVRCIRGAGHRVLCPSGQRFDPEIGGCRKGAPCNKFSCGSHDEGLNIPYPGDPSFYALCSERKAAFLRSCAPGQQFIRNSAATGQSGCQAFCPGIGNFPNYSNCQSFYSCYISNRGALIPIVSYCPGTQVFSPAAGKCIVPVSDADVTCAQDQDQNPLS